MSLFAMAFLLVGCHRALLNCRSEYLYPDYLASEHVLTPDPCRTCFFGQQVIVKWNVKRSCLPLVESDSEKSRLELVLHVRYGSREQATFSWPIMHSPGYRIYRLINDEYWCNEGIISYKAELYRDGVQIADWKHHLWVDVIEITRCANLPSENCTYNFNG